MSYAYRCLSGQHRNNWNASGPTVQRITTTGTGTAFVPIPFQDGDVAFGGVVEVDQSAEPTYTALKAIIEMGFNVLSGWLWTPANDDEVIVIPPSGLVGFNLDTAPSTGMTFNYGCTIREAG